MALPFVETPKSPRTAGSSATAKAHAQPWARFPARPGSRSFPAAHDARGQSRFAGSAARLASAGARYGHLEVVRDDPTAEPVVADQPARSDPLLQGFARAGPGILL